MTRIEIHILAGPSQGKRLAVSKSPVTFGRATDRTIIIPDTAISREHGEVIREGDQWLLVNYSPNGTWCDGKKVTKRPRKLKGGETVSVADIPLFTVNVQDSVGQAEVAPTAPTSTKSAPAAPVTSPSGAGSGAVDAQDADRSAQITDAGMSRKAKLWIGIGIYLFLMLAVLIYLAFNRADSNAGPALPPPLTEAQIDEEITAPVRVTVTDEILARQKRDEAVRYHNLQQLQSDALFRSHHAFKESLALSGQTMFQGENAVYQEQFLGVQRELIDEIIKRYNNVNNHLKRGDFTAAERAIDNLKKFYPNHGSPLFRDLEQRHTIARQNMPR